MNTDKVSSSKTPAFSEGQTSNILKSAKNVGMFDELSLIRHEMEPLIISDEYRPPALLMDSQYNVSTIRDIGFNDYGEIQDRININNDYVIKMLMKRKRSPVQFSVSIPKHINLGTIFFGNREFNDLWIQLTNKLNIVSPSYALNMITMSLPQLNDVLMASRSGLEPLITRLMQCHLNDKNATNQAIQRICLEALAAKIGPLRSLQWLITSSKEEQLNETILGYNGVHMTQWYKQNAYILMSFFVSMLETTSQFRKSIAFRMMNTPYIERIIYAPDASLITPDEETYDDDFLRLLYHIRNFCGIKTDFGRKRTRIAHSLSASTTSEHLLEPETYHDVKGDTVSDYANSFMNSVLNMFSGILSILLGSVKSILNQLGSWMVKNVLEQYGITTYGFWRKLIIVTILLGLVTGFGPLSFLQSAFTWVFRPTTATSVNVNITAPHLREREAHSAIGLFSIITTMFCFDKPTEKALSNWCLTIMRLTATGTIALHAFYYLLQFLPPLVSQALRYQFGSKDERDALKVDQWRMKADCLVAMGQVTEYLTDPGYRDDLSETIRGFTELWGDVTNATLRIRIGASYANLLKIHATLVEFTAKRAYRSQPFSFHVYGDAGVGKSACVKYMMQRFGYATPEVYNVPVADSFWSGYVAQKAIIWDEFMCGNADTAELAGRTYLQCISSMQFQPPMASVDSLNVGRKGTVCSPDLVITMNNSFYTSASGVDENALKRRRKFVVKIVRSPEFETDASGQNLDFQHYVNEGTVHLCPWARFHIQNPFSTSDEYAIDGYNKSTPLTFQEFTDIASGFLDNHRHTKEILDKQDEIHLITQTYEEAKNDIMRTCYGMPRMMVDLKDKVTKFLIEGFVSFIQRPVDLYSGMKGLLSTPMNILNRMRSPHAPDRRRHPKLRGILLTEKNVDAVLNMRPRTSETMKPPRMTSVESVSDADSYASARSITMSMPYIGEPIKPSMDQRMMEATMFSNELYAYYTYGAGAQVDKIPEAAWKNNMAKAAYLSGTQIPGIYSITREHLAPTHTFLKFDVDSKRMLRLFREERDQYERGELTRDQAIELSDAKIEVAPPHAALRSSDEPFVEFPANLWGAPEPEVLSDIVENMDDEVGNSLSWGKKHSTFWKTCKLLTESIISSVLVVSFIIIVKMGVETLLGQKPVDPEIRYAHQDDSSARSNGRTRQSRTTKVHSTSKNYSREPHAMTGHSSCVKLIFPGPIETNAFALGENLYMTYRHWFDTADFDTDEQIEVQLLSHSKSYTTTISLESNSISTSTDILLLYLPFDKIDPYPYFLHRFLTTEQVNNYNRNRSILSIEGVNLYKQSPGCKFKPRYANELLTYSKGKYQYELHDGIEYDFVSKPGYCGYTVWDIQTNPDIPQFLGLHLGGDKTTSFCNFVERDVMTEALMELSTKLNRDFEQLKRSTENNYGAHGSNVIHVDTKSKEFVQYVSQDTAIRKSPIYGLLSEPPSSQPAILHISDERSKNRDPIQISIDNLSKSQHIDLDEHILEEVFDDMLVNYENQLIWPLGRRTLSLDEAVLGIPGKMASVMTATSPGYPFIFTKKTIGKRDHLRIKADGTYWISDLAKHSLKKLEEEMEDYNGDFTGIQHRFMGYLKDELRSESKIEKCETRMIFANDMIASLAFRKLTGSLLVAFQHSWHLTPMSVGMNPLSYDWDVMYQYLVRISKDTRETRWLSGDFKAYDQRHVRQFREKAYEMIRRLLGDVVTDAQFAFITDHETKTPFQIGREIYKTGSNHFSGCFFTTTLNCLVLEAYIRYSWRFLTNTHFDDHARLKCLGDDNVLTVDSTINFTPLDLQKQLSLIGQEFTHSTKNKSLTEEWFSMDEVSFLGAFPVRVGDRYCGALRKETLWNTPQWIKTKNADFYDTVEAMLRYASVWPRSFFEYYQEDVRRAFEKKGLPLPKKYAWASTRMRIAMATVSEGYVAHGGDGLTILPTETGLSTDDSMKKTKRNIAINAVNDSAKDIDFGMDSIVYRDSVVWQQSQTAGTLIYTVDIPFGLLALGESENVQNMPFTRFIFSETQLTVYFQINASPFQQGMLVAFFSPLSDPRDLVNQPLQETIYNYPSVRIQPNESGTHALEIPMIWYRNVLNTFAGGLGSESFGYIGLYVVNPLASINPLSAVITIQSRFHNTRFTIPRPVESTLEDKLRYTTSNLKRLEADLLKMNPAATKEIQATIKMMKTKSTGQYKLYEAHGASSSKSNSNITYNIENVIGDVPIQNSIGTSQTTAAEGSLDVQGLPMDKPPLSSGTLPIFGALPSNSKNIGLEPVMAMQHHPLMMHREPMNIGDSDETKISTLMGKASIHSIVRWSIDQTENTELRSITLNSLLNGNPVWTGLPMSTPLAILNSFKFWRADIVFTFEVIKTPYHSGRLSVSVGYGTRTVTPSTRNIYYNKIMNFSEDNAVESWTVKWNAGTEYLRTFDSAPNRTLHPIQDYALGTLLLCVHNRLQCPTTVVQYVDIIISYHFENVFLYENANLCPISPTVNQPIITTQGVLKSEIPLTTTTIIPTSKTTPKLLLETTTSKQEQDILAEYLGKGYTLGASEYKKVGTKVVGKYCIDDNRRMIWSHSKGISKGSKEPTEACYEITREAHSGAPIPGEETKVVDDEPPSQSITAEETEEPTSIPMKLSIGRKFEYHPQYLEEIFRRYIPVKAGQYVSQMYVSDDLTRPEFSSMITAIEPRWVLSKLFKMWSGHMQYRAIHRSHNLAWSRLINTPALSRLTEYIPCPITFGESRYNTRNGYPVRMFDEQHSVDFTPNELFVPYGSNMSYLNLSIPFNTHYSNLKVPDSDTTGWTSRAGIPTFHSFLEFISQSSDISLTMMFESAGDDFKLSVYSPRRLYWYPASIDGSTRQIYGYILP